MYDKEKLETRIEEFNEYNNKIYEKNLPENILNTFHNIVIKLSKSLNFIIKGSRSAQAILPINFYKNDEIKYSDYDLLSENPFEDLKKIGVELKNNGVDNVKISNIIFKIDIFRLSIYGIPLIDAEFIKPRIFNKIPYVLVDNTRYLDLKFWKIDLYSILCRPVYINVKNWKKTLNRLSVVEEYYPYKTTTKTSSLPNNINMIEKIVSSINNSNKINKDSYLITGSYAYSKLVDNTITVPYLEILSHNYFNIIKNLLDIFKKFGRITTKRNEEYLYMMSYNTVFYLNNKPICVLYNITMCSAYVIKDDVRYTNMYYLRFYYNFLKYSLYNFIDNVDYYEYLLSKIELPRLPTLECMGDINPGVKEYMDFMRKFKDKRITYVV